MKKVFNYCVTWGDGRQTVESIEADNIMDGHVRLFFKFWRVPYKAYYIR